MSQGSRGGQETCVDELGRAGCGSGPGTALCWKGLGVLWGVSARVSHDFPGARLTECRKENSGSVWSECSSRLSSFRSDQKAVCAFFICFFAASTTAAVACKASSRSGTRRRLRTSGFALGNPLVARVWPFVPELPPLPLIRTMRGALQGALSKRQQAGLLARRP